MTTIEGPTAEPMPVFTIKAKDRFAPAAVEAYRAICENAGSTEQAHQVALAGQEIKEWQQRHPDLLQFPDHQHIPAAHPMNAADPMNAGEVPTTPPADWYPALARVQAERWQYTITLDPEDLERYVHERAEDPNVRADIDAVYALARPMLVDLQRRLDAAQATIGEYEHAINWFTTCTSCATILDSAYAETVRREQAEDEVARMRPVVEAANRWRGLTLLVQELTDVRMSQPSRELAGAVDAYRAGTEVAAAPAVDAQAPQTTVAEGYGEDAGSPEAQRAAEAVDEEEALRLFREDDPAIAVLADDELVQSWVRLESPDEETVRVDFAGCRTALSPGYAEALGAALIRKAREAREVTR